MKRLVRLRQIRALQERVAESALLAARREAEAAARRLADLAEYESAMRRDVLAAVVEGDPAGAYLSGIAEGLAQAAAPDARRGVEAKDELRRGRAAEYDAARRDHAALEELCAKEDLRMRRLREGSEQRSLDEAHGARLYRAQGERAQGEASGNAWPEDDSEG